MSRLFENFFNLRLSKLVLPLFVLLIAQTVANAQYLNFRGDWEGFFSNGTKSTYVWRITQTGADLNFQDVGGSGVVFKGQTSGRTVTDSSGKTGTVSDDGTQIKWSDGVIWKKRITAPSSQLFPDGSLINLVADNGYRMTRCNGCEDIAGGINLSDTVVLTSSGESDFTTFEVRNTPSGKILLKADNGNSVSYCNGCISGEVVPENTLVESKYNPGNVFGQFELTKLANGKYTLKTANGKYLARCFDCSPSLYRRTNKNRNAVTSHIADPNSPYVQWTILLSGYPNPVAIQNPELTAPRFSFESNPYVKVKDNDWRWNGGHDRTIYNPLDGGVLLQYNFGSQGNSDGCSGPSAPREKELFQQACFAHDANYDAPFPLAGFPAYPNGKSTGQEISDYLFFKDMKLINDNARAKNNGLTNFINDSAANVFYATVTVFGTFRGTSDGKSILAKGGVIAVQNDSSVYNMTLKVTWNAPDGTARSAEVTKPVRTTAVIPLSVGATNIKAVCSADLGTTIFTKNFSGPGMYAYTVTGTTLIHDFKDGLANNP